MLPVASAPAPSFPVIDWPRMVRLREIALGHGQLPHYLLQTEIAGLLDALPDWRQRLLVELLWCTGARINELLALTPADLYLALPEPYCLLRTLKQQRKGRGAAPQGRAWPAAGAAARCRGGGRFATLPGHPAAVPDQAAVASDRTDGTQLAATGPGPRRRPWPPPAAAGDTACAAPQLRHALPVP